MKAPDIKTLAAKIATMVGAGIMLALTGVAVKLYIKSQTIFPILMAAIDLVANLVRLGRLRLAVSNPKPNSEPKRTKI